MIRPRDVAVVLAVLAGLARPGAAQPAAPASDDDDDAIAQRAGEKLADVAERAERERLELQRRVQALRHAGKDGEATRLRQQAAGRARQSSERLQIEMERVVAEATAPLQKRLQLLVARGRRGEAQQIEARMSAVKIKAYAVMSSLQSDHKREATAARRAAKPATPATPAPALPALCSDAERSADQAEAQRLQDEFTRTSTQATALIGEQIKRGLEAKPADPALAKRIAAAQQQVGTLLAKTTRVRSRCDLIVAQRTAQTQTAETLEKLRRSIPTSMLDPGALDLGVFAHQAANQHDEVIVLRADAMYGKRRPLDARAPRFWDHTLQPVALYDIDTGVEDDAILHDVERTQIVDAYLRSIELLAHQAAAPGDPKLASRLTGLAAIYQLQGADDKAEQALLRALDLREKALGPAAPEVAASLTRLGEQYQQRGAYDKAEPALLRALDLREKALGANDPDVALSLHALGLLYRDQGAYDKAEPRLRAALDLLDKAHPDDAAVATCLENLAELHEARGAYDQAEPLLARAADIREARLDAELVSRSYQSQRAVMILLQGETDHVVSLQADAMPGGSPALALTTVLRRKARVVDALTGAQTALRVHPTPELQRKLDELTAARAERKRSIDELAAHFRVNDLAGAASGPAAFLAAESRVKQLEAESAAMTAALRTATPLVAIGDVQAKLPAGAALIEFARYRRFDARHAEQPWREERYVAYVVTAQGSPRSVGLGDAAAIDAGVDAVLATMHAPAHDKASAALTMARAALRRLDAQVLTPVAALLPEGTTHLIIAPDDQLGLVPFEALLDPQGRYATTKWLMSYVTSGAELLRHGAAEPAQSPAVLIAAPDFGTPVKRAPQAPAVASQLQPLPHDRAIFRRLSPLPGTFDEARDLQPYFAAAALTGGAASKAALTALRGPAILHLATHGFSQTTIMAALFLELHDGKPDAPSRGRPGRGVDIAPAAPGSAEDAPAAPPPRVRELWRDIAVDGLALAGANRGAEGILTTRDIAGLDWHGTQLVVLSACETGVGVFGMRRAVTLAGAAAQVVSLWRTDDAATRELMRAFYRGLAGGAGRADALRRARLDLLQQPGYEHPYFWAAFVHAGDWTPLPAGTLRAPGSP